MYRDPNKPKSLADDVPGITLSPRQRRQQSEATARQQTAARMQQDAQAVTGTLGMLGDAALGAATLRPVRRVLSNTTTSSQLPREDSRQKWRDQAQDRWRASPEGQQQMRAGQEQREQVKASMASAIPSPPESERPRIEIPSALAEPEQRRADQRAAIDATGGPVALEGQVLAQNMPDTLPRRAEGQEWGSLYGGIVGRRNADGVMEFSNQTGDQAAASGRVMRDGRMGDGKGSLSVISLGGGEDGRRSRERANATREQMRLERTNPNYVTVVRPTGGGSLQAAMNERLNRRDERDRAERSAAHQARIDAGRQRLAQFGQEDDQRALQARQQLIEDERLGMDRTRFGWETENQEAAVAERQRLDQLREIMSDPSASAADRAMAQSAYQAATIPAKDRFVRMDSVMGQDVHGQPIMGSQIIDVATGQPVMTQGLGQQGGPQVVTSEEVRDMARLWGVTESAVRKRAEENGYEVRD